MISPIRVAINGYGRIGRCVLRSIYENNLNNIYKIIAINDLNNIEVLAHLTQYDTVHGRFNANVSLLKNKLSINGDIIDFFNIKDLNLLKWDNIDLIFECTGAIKSKKVSQYHLKAGAKRVLVSSPCLEDIDLTVVYGVNHELLNKNMTCVSNASCTTNCLATIVKPLQEKLGIEYGSMTTIHSYTNDQSIVDNGHKDLYRSRALCNIIPTSTGAASIIGSIIPVLDGKLNGFAMRVPTPNVSVVDFTFKSVSDTSVEEVNRIFQYFSQNSLKDTLFYNNDKLVSSDFNHNNYAAIFDSTQTLVTCNSLVKILAWYDNEWGFARQMLRTAYFWCLINKNWS